MRKRLSMLLAVCCMMTAFSVPASATEYSFDGQDAGLFGTPTSDETIYVTTAEPVNTDRSKNAAYIPPTFGSPTSYTLNAGELLTPNLVKRNIAGVCRRQPDTFKSRCEIYFLTAFLRKIPHFLQFPLDNRKI